MPCNGQITLSGVVVVPEVGASRWDMLFPYERVEPGRARPQGKS
jgi:hypothetical protein